MDNSSGIPKKSKIDELRDFKISRMKPKIKATNPHKHDEYHELIYLTEGAGFHTVDLTTYQIETPSLFLVKAGEVHYWEFTEMPDGFVTIFKSSFLAHLASKATYSSFNQTKNRYFPVSGPNKFPFNSLFELMETEYVNNQDASTRIIASSLELIFTQMIRLSKRQKKAPLDRQENLFRKLQALLDNHISEYHQVKDYADLLNVTPKYLNDITKRKAQKTASNLIAETLILEAQRQLLYSSRNVSEIGDALGFSSASHFIKYFKSRVATTPQQYRISGVTDVSSSP